MGKLARNELKEKFKALNQKKHLLLPKKLKFHELCILDNDCGLKIINREERKVCQQCQWYNETV